MRWIRKSTSSASPATAGERQLSLAFAGSTLVHLGLVLFLAGIVIIDDSNEAFDAVSTEWTGASPLPVVVDEVFPPIEVERRSRDDVVNDGGGANAALFEKSAAAPSPKRPNSGGAVATASDHGFRDIRLLDEVGGTPVVGPESGGAGEGNAAGSGDGTGFFGMNADGKSFVFVVDGSRSMYYPHPEPYKTRFKRLKMEIVKSVGALSAEQEFFIVFFSEEAYPMPARGLQPATDQAKHRYLNWMTEVRANGKTDPISAFQLALQFQPDVIYFLTDGAFPKPVDRKLLTLKQQRTEVHTYVFGETGALDVMRKIAANNRGTCTFIPNETQPPKVIPVDSPNPPVLP